VLAPALPLSRWRSPALWHPLLRVASLLAIGLVAIGAVGRGQAQTVPIALVGLVVGVVAVVALFRGAERRFLLTLFLVSYAIRLSVALVLDPLLITTGRDKSGNLRGPWVGYLFEDDRAYDNVSWDMARVWLGVLPGVESSDAYLLKNYTYMIGAIYYLVGHELIAAKFVNALFGALVPVAVYAFGRELGGDRVGRIAAVAAALWPSLILWSVLNLKDVLVVLLIAIIMWGAHRFARSPGLAVAVGTLAAFALIENLRLYVFYAFGWLIPVAFFLINRSPWPRRLAIGVPFTLTILAVMVLSNQGTQWLGLRYLTDKRQEALASSREFGAGVAESGIELEDIPRSQGGWIIQLTNSPRVLPYVLFAPFPWSVRGRLAAMIPEMIAWYVVEALALLALALYLRTRWRALFLSMVYVGGLIAIFSLIEGNVGTIFRHRAMLFPALFVAAGMSLVWLYERWGGRRAVAAPVTTPISV
jgi:hypothetical protein